MPLEAYRKKRNFARTAEPRGELGTRKPGFSFVVQKHSARALHYDFRLELDGVLLSWAVPKGPSLNPAVRRLAMQTEDHPVEYGSFEGTIPEGEYGAGPVAIWDRGHWEPEGDPREQYRKGRLTFNLHGERLRGRFHLVRTGGPGGRRWLLFKGRDEEASAEKDRLLSRAPDSVVTERSLDEIRGRVSARAKQRRPATRRPAPRTASKRRVVSGIEGGSGGRTPANRSAPTELEAILADAPKRALPATLDVELATLSKTVPDGPEWLHEIKLDGYRLLCRVDGASVTLTTRNGNDFTARAPHLVRALAGLGLEGAVFDGEVVVLREDGVSDFQRLQNVLNEGATERMILYVFDLLAFAGRDLRGLPLERRKQALAAVLSHRSLPGCLRPCDHVRGGGPEFFRRACAAGLEGIVSKRADAPYRSGRGRDWIKVKCSARQEFVIGGYTEPEGARSDLGALLVGVYRDGELRFAGKVGTGFTRESLLELHERLAPLERKTPPFVDPPKSERRGVHWVSPELVAEVEFTEFTRDGRLRHPSFQGLREDKPARAVTREVPTDPPTRERLESPRLRTPQFESTVRLTHPDKVLYPDRGLTKRDIAEYYARIAERMLPHVVERPLMLVRCPEGRRKSCFYQKHAQRGLPEPIRVVPIREEAKTASYTYVENVEGLLALTQMGVLEIHTWGARVGDVEHPDLLVFDLDPDPEVPWPEVTEGARLVRDLFHRLDLEAFVKTTGGKGLHVCVPLRPRLGWDEIKLFCKTLAEGVARLLPARYVATMAKAKRRGKIFVDYLRNARGATFIAPYSTRARPGAPVATPVFWEELDAVRPDGFTVENLPRRLATLRADPFAELAKLRQNLTESRVRALERALSSLTR